MTEDQQIEFVQDLSDNIALDIKQSIRAGNVPDTWDGHELRTLLLCKHQESASMSRQVMRGSRLKSFYNEVRTKNL